MANAVDAYDSGVSGEPGFVLESRAGVGTRRKFQDSWLFRIDIAERKVVARLVRSLLVKMDEEQADDIVEVLHSVRKGTNETVAIIRNADQAINRLIAPVWSSLLRCMVTSRSP